MAVLFQAVDSCQNFLSFLCNRSAFTKVFMMKEEGIMKKKTAVILTACFLLTGCGNKITKTVQTETEGHYYSEEEATEILKKEKVQIISDMHMGEAEAVAWGCDLTHDYVSINADYRS